MKKIILTVLALATISFSYTEQLRLYKCIEVWGNLGNKYEGTYKAYDGSLHRVRFSSYCPAYYEKDLSYR